VSNSCESLALSDHEAEKIAASAWQMCRELLPSNKIESDEALAARIVFLKEIIYAVGPERFIDAVKQSIRLSQYRSEVTINRIRQCAGLQDTLPPSPAVQAWALVTQIARDHVARDAQGNVVLEDKVRIKPGTALALITPVPEIPEAVQAAVDAMGGWAAMYEAYPAWWSQKFSQFERCYR